MAVGLLALASFVLAGLDFPRTAVPLYGVAVAMALVPTAERRWLSARGRTIPLVYPAMALSLSLSVVVAQIADRHEPFESYWPAFALWAGAVVLPLGAALQPLLPTPTEWPRRALSWMRSHAPELAVVAGITAVAATVRFINLTSMPSPFGGDEAALAYQAVRVAKGEITNMFQSGLQGHPHLYFFQMSGLHKVLGTTVFGSRAFGAFAGTFTVVLLYLFLRQAFDRRVAILGAAYLAAYHFHVHFSRQDMNNATTPLVTMVTALFLWRAMRYGKPVDFVATGMAVGVGLNAEAGARIAAPVVVAVIVLVALTRRGFMRDNALNLALLLGAFVVAALPIGLFWIRDQDAFMDRMKDVGIFQSGWLEQEAERTGRSELSLLWDQVTHSFGGFGYYTDQGMFYRAPISLVERVSVVPFVAGFLVAAWRFREPRHAILLALFVGTVLAGGVLTIGPPSVQRLLPTAPAIAAFVGLGLVTLAGLVLRRRPQLIGLALAASLALLVSTNLQFYFFQYVRGDYWEGWNQKTLAQAAVYVRDLPDDTRVYWHGAPYVFVGATIWFLAPDKAVTDVFEDGTEHPPLESAGYPKTFLFLPHRSEDLQELQARCPGGRTEAFVGSDGEPSFTAYSLGAEDTCSPR